MLKIKSLIQRNKLINYNNLKLQKLLFSTINTNEKNSSSSTSTSNSNSSSSNSHSTSFVDQYRPQLQQGAIIGGIGITLYGLSTFIWDLTYGLMNMTPFQSGYYGFLTGLVTSAVLGGSAYYGKRTSVIHPGGILRKSLYTLNSNSDVRIAFGGQLSSSELATFKSSNAAWKLENWKPVWNPAKVEMIFKVHSGKTEGVATVIATQVGLHSKIEFLGVDVFNKDSLRILVNGNAKDFSLHDTLRSKVTFN
mmetsp:Transcript_18297/g.19061  ORF Transcript_18297/g.19061 Transcript_18297/m.19061 type:complete len:250 (+) Transcript_18297:68-817(+)